MRPLVLCLLGTQVGRGFQVFLCPVSLGLFLALTVPNSVLFGSNTSFGDPLRTLAQAFAPSSLQKGIPRERALSRTFSHST